MAPDACIFELHDVDNDSQLASRRHDRGKCLMWDPSGRMVASATLSDLNNESAKFTKGYADDGINFYTFQGNHICTLERRKLWLFAWRPRPKNLMTAEQHKAVLVGLKKYAKSFESEDKMKKAELYMALQKKRRDQANEFFDLLRRNTARNALLKVV